MNSQRLRPHEERPHRVYVLRNRRGAILYIGVSSDVDKRIAWHLRRQPWRNEVDPAKTVRMDEMSWEDALALEQVSIQEHHPKYNKRQRNGSAYVDAGVRTIIATQERLKRTARHGDPEAVAALIAWEDEQTKQAVAHLRANPGMFDALFERAS
jgi:predicted GIY-YIG superfamily endonuclease